MNLVHYYHAGSTPLRSISRLPKEEAFALARSLHETHPCIAHKRFSEARMDWYWERRLNAERQLHEEFIALGGKPETEHPIYFALQGGGVIDNLYRNFDEAKTIAVPLSSIDPACLSFTYGDSVALYDHPARRGPFMKDSLKQLLEKHGGLDALLQNLEPVYMYIEAQAWVEALKPV